ncbi:MAG: hypothetical protein KIT11_11260 [Fimbriimonadaceae bacterium]|nr:hypothetical protein [Fimbriimonadaceae bacterium]QYK55389.1 MAG: hypothetical protein KF733_10275 [Fimbriimonadaceae bacterium]
MRVIPLALLLAASLSAWAQDTAFDRHVASVELLQSKAIQSELKVSDSQRAALNKHADWYNKQTADIIKSLGQRPSETAQKGAADRIGGLQKQLKERVLNELSKWQMSRLREISLQQLGVLAVMDTQISKKIGVSDSQLEKIRAFWNKTGTSVAEIERKARQPIWDKYKDKKPKDEAEAKKLQESFSSEMEAASRTVAPDLAKHKKAFEDYVDGVLSSAQKEKWKALKGTPFKG